MYNKIMVIGVYPQAIYLKSSGKGGYRLKYRIRNSSIGMAKIPNLALVKPVVTIDPTK
jgi:hypothetical protein